MLRSEKTARQLRSLLSQGEEPGAELAALLRLLSYHKSAGKKAAGVGECGEVDDGAGG